jgi:hypothetical protein
MNLLRGAAVLHRLHVLRCQGVSLPQALGKIAPVPFE